LKIRICGTTCALNSLWEGSGNVAALDVLRAIVAEPEGLPAFLAECELAAGGDARVDAHRIHMREETAETLGDEDAPQERADHDQFAARRLVEELVLALGGLAPRPPGAARRRRRALRRGHRPRRPDRPRPSKARQRAHFDADLRSRC
jgi:hypothetical protein